MSKAIEELKVSIEDTLHSIHQDLAQKLSNGERLSGLISQIEEVRQEVLSKIDEHEVVLAGNKHHEGIRQVVKRLETKLEIISDFIKILESEREAEEDSKKGVNTWVKEHPLGAIGIGGVGFSSISVYVDHLLHPIQEATNINPELINKLSKLLENINI